MYMRINPDEIEAWNEGTKNRLLMFWDTNTAARRHIALSNKCAITAVPEIIF
jgi:hypothetical protein